MTKQERWLAEGMRLSRLRCRDLNGPCSLCQGATMHLKAFQVMVLSVLRKLEALSLSSMSRSTTFRLHLLAAGPTGKMSPHHTLALQDVAVCTHQVLDRANQ